jgi:hypothetical protein
MRTLLRDPATGQYFESLERWTSDQQQAHDFGPIERAVKFAHKAHFADMELVLTFEVAESDPEVPFDQFRFKGFGGGECRRLAPSVPRLGR